MQSGDFEMYDHIAHSVFVLGPDEDDRPVYLYMNSSGCTRIGRTQDQIAGQPAYALIPGRAGRAVYERQCAAWTEGCETEYMAAISVVDAPIWVQTNLRDVRDAQGRLTHMVGTTLDITQDRERLHARAMAVAATREMEDLICIAAHDLRSPIGNLKSLAEVMRQDFVDHGDGKAQLIEMIDSIADKGLEIISGVMAQAVAGGAVDPREMFDLGTLCDDIMVMLDPMRRHLAHFEAVQLDADCTVVQIILRNLIDNAIKHGQRTQASICVSVHQMNAERLLFSVRDDGVGFGAVAESGLPGAAGGFGLQAVRRLAQSRGGNVEILHDDAGARVQFELPGRIVTDVRDGPAHISARAGAA